MPSTKHDSIATPGKKHQCKYIAPPVDWKKKVVKGKGWDIKVIQQRADEATEGLLADYLVHARSELDAIENAMAVAQSASKEERDEALRVVRKVAHEMRSEAGTLGYPLITRIGASLCDYIDGAGDLDAVQLKAIAIHADAMRVVITDNMAGDGGDEAKQLLAGIENLVSKTL